MRGWVLVAALAPAVALAQVPAARPMQQLPAGFVAETVYGVSRMQNYYPAGQNAAAWRQRITTTLLAVRGVSPAVLLGRMADRWAAGCPGAAPAPVAQAAQGRHPAAQLELDCPLVPGSAAPEHSLVRAVADGTTVFLAEYTFHYEPDPAERAQAMAYLATVELAP